jgi:dTDP-4-amino-4,6-dideoxygalactose transaminase
MVTTQDAELARKLRLLRSHGMTRDPSEMDHPSEDGWYYEQQMLGFNYRLTDFQSALGLSQLKRMVFLHAQRVVLANRYDQLLEDLPMLLPARFDDRVSAWHLYAIEIDGARTRQGRAAVFKRLRNAQIGVNVHYIPIHTQPYYTRLGFKLGDFPVAERYYERALSLPLFPAMTEDQQSTVVEALCAALIAN